MPNSRIFGATTRRRWRPGALGSSRRRQARTPERRSQSGLLSHRPPNTQGWLSALVQRLQPAPHAALVIAVGVAEPPFQVRLLARNDAIADRDGKRHREDQGPRAARRYANAAIDDKQAEIDGIAAPAVNARCDQRAGGLARRHWRCRPQKVANTGGGKDETDEDEGATECPMDPVAPRNGERKGQQAIRGEAEQKSGEKEKGRSRYDASRCGVVHLCSCRVHAHVYSRSG